MSVLARIILPRGVEDGSAVAQTCSPRSASWLQTSAAVADLPAPRSVEADEGPADAHAGISGSSRRSPDVTGHTSASTAPIRSPAEMTAAGQPLPHEAAMPHAPQVGLAPIA